MVGAAKQAHNHTRVSTVDKHDIALPRISHIRLGTVLHVDALHEMVSLTS